MILRFAAVSIGFLLCGCSPTHQIAIGSEEPVKRVDFVLDNVRKTKVEIRDSHHVFADVWAADSGGRIVVTMASGKLVTCEAGYMTNGDIEPHIYLIDGGECRQEFQE
jgi:hypothetical protein